MPRYSKICTKCGKALHPKQVIFDEVIKVNTKSALVSAAKEYHLSFCAECCADLVKHLMDMLMTGDYNHFVVRYGNQKD